MPMNRIESFQASPQDACDEDNSNCDIELRLLESLRRIIQVVSAHSRDLARKHRVTTPQLVLMKAVAEDPEMSIAAISRKIRLTSSTVVGIVDRLEAKGWVQRQRSTSDRRVVHVVLTDAGRELIESAPNPLQETLTRSLKKLPELEQTAIALSLERVVELMQAEDIPASPMLEAGPLEKDVVGGPSVEAADTMEVRLPSDKPV